MSYYYKYTFINPDPVYASVKQELRSYFDSNAVDDMMFPFWTNTALQKLGKATRPILETILHQQDFESKLPPQFYGVREAWLCTILEQSMWSPNAKYDQVFCKITPEYDSCATCPDCLPEVLRVTYKSNEIGNVPSARMQRIYLLKPGNIETAQHCELPLANLGASTADTYDIRGNKFVTNLRQGVIHLIYYSEYRDDEENHRLIPDSWWIIEYVKRYIKFKLFEQLWNQTTDETYQQIKQKMDYYKTGVDEAWIEASTEIKKKTPYEIQQSIKRDTSRLHPYRIGLNDANRRY